MMMILIVIRTDDNRTVSFHNFKSRNCKLRISNPKMFFRIFIRTMSNSKWPENSGFEI